MLSFYCQRVNPELSGVVTRAEEGATSPLLSGGRISASDDLMHRRGSCHELERVTLASHVCIT